MARAAATHSIEAHLESLVGQRIGPYTAFNPVSRLAIWQWCAAMGDRNPLYLDDNYQAANGIDGPIAPPAMMQVWNMRDVNMAYAEGSTDDPPFPAIDYLAANGFPGNVAVSYDLRFHRLLREGERVYHYKSIDTISGLKKTALGEGYFFTDRSEYMTGDDELFAEAFITYFQYKPNGGNAPDNAGEPPSAAGSWRSDHADIDAGKLAEGSSLPELGIPITHKLIVSGAMAAQDFEDGHHNIRAARAAAMPDIFMNILTTCGLSARYLTDWAGAGSRIERLSFKLLAPNVPGDVMVMQGRVAELKQREDATQAVVEYAGRNSRGFHVTGSATLALPR